MKPILVKWQDAVSHDEWEEMEEAKNLDPHTIITLGFLVDENDDRLIVGLNWDEERDAVAQTISIPKAWILSRRFIKVKLS